MNETPTSPGPPLEMKRGSRHVGLLWAVAVLALVALGVWGTDAALISQPVGRRLAQDTRNRPVIMSAHFAGLVNHSVLVLNIHRADDASPIDLFRVVFQTAEVLESSGRRFERVELAHKGVVIYALNGSDFSELGREWAAGQNPIYLVRTLPERLYGPDGRAAFGRWEGGMLGVLERQMEDATEAATRWGRGGK